MPDWFASNSPKTSTASSGDWFSLYDPTRKPASAEDFVPASRDVSGGAVLWNALKSVPSGIRDMIVSSYQDQRPEDAALGPARVLAPLIRQAGSGALSEAGKAFAAPSVSEAIGHGAAAALPLVGPAAAQAGEDIGSGDPERIERGGGNALAMVGSTFVPRVVPKVAPGLATIADQIAAKAGPTLTKAGPLLKEAAITGVLETAAHGLGVPPAVATAIRVLLKQAGKGAKAAAPEAEAAANVGGRLAGKAPTLTEALTDALRSVNQPEPPSRITTPPEPQLPAGYQPRTTVPKPKASKPTPATEPAPEPAQAEPTPPKRAYFLRSPEEIEANRAAASEPQRGPRLYFQKPETTAATESPSAPASGLNVSDLPTSWRSRVTADFASKMKAATAEDVSALAQQLADSGLSPSEAITAVAKNPNLPAPVRAQLMKALLRAGVR